MDDDDSDVEAGGWTQFDLVVARDAEDDREPASRRASAGTELRWMGRDPR